MIRVSAPSNIAFIKYMGKTDTRSNIPTNASLSYTVDYLQTHLELSEASDDTWLELPGYYPLALSEKGQAKFLHFFKKLKERFQISGNYLIRSANTFPADAGLASSASSFAALTMATWKLCLLQHGDQAYQILNAKHVEQALAMISRTGSGSSCRSFFTGFCQWSGTSVAAVDLGYSKLKHIVLLLEEGKKSVSSSEAHVRVTTSPQFIGRPERAEKRLADLTAALKSKHWVTARKLVWDEFIDMHNLFETSLPPFSFIQLESRKVLGELLNMYERDGDGPIVTMDAGPNIHMFFHEGQAQMFSIYKQTFSNLKMLASNET
jgi:diphosphomevalonate decarboxylase